MSKPDVIDITFVNEDDSMQWRATMCWPSDVLEARESDSFNEPVAWCVESWRGDAGGEDAY
jgi:hypothetical protein